VANHIQAAQNLFGWAQTLQQQAAVEPVSLPEPESLHAVSFPVVDQPAPTPPADRPRSREEKHERIQQMTAEALGQLSDALDAGRSETLKAYLTTMAKFHTYSFGNQMLIAWQRPDATHVAGFHAWKKLGRTVNKGEHGIMILAPITRKVGTAEEHHADGTTETEGIRRLVNVKPVYVFDINQTQGKELPEFARVSGDPAHHMQNLKDFVSSKGIVVEYAKNLGGAEGLSQGGKILVREGLPPAEEFHVLAHEVGHELLHRGERRKETTKKIRETEAEAVAFVVCTAIGLNAGTSSSDYISLYNGNRETLTESLEHIRRVASEIIGAVTASRLTAHNGG
jgi:hypothetical protein